MRGKGLSSNISCSNCEEPTECMVNLSVPQLKPGDIAWSRIDGGSWWPVQVVDEKCVAFKPTKRKNDQVLVRLYGTFEHLYLEPINCVLKIENIYGQESCSGKELFKKALEEDLARMTSACRSKRKFCKSKENEKDESPRRKSSRKGKLERALVADSPVVVSSRKQVKVVVDKDMDTVQASADGLAKQDEMKSAELKRRTRSETFKARNANSMVNCSNKKDSMNFRHKDAEEKVTANIQNIKKFVAKIVKEVAAEKAQNEALEGRAVQVCPENTKCMESSRKDASEIKHMNKCSPRRAEDEIAGLSDAGKPNMADKKGTGASLVKSSRQYNLRKRGFNSADNGTSKDTRVDVCNPTARKQCVIDLSDIAEQAKEKTQGINGVNKMTEDENALANVAKQGGVANSSGTEMARNDGDQSCKDASREQMESHGSTKCKVPEEHEDLSLRSTRVMQTLGLIAPSGSPFSKNGLIKSLLPDFPA